MKKIKRSEKYYIDRFVKQENIAHELSLTKQKQLKSVYREASKELETELAFFIERYSKENELTPADLKRMLNTKEKANFRYSVKKYVEEIERLGADTKEGKALKKELDILAGRTRVSRKEELIATLNAELSKTSMKVSKTIGEHLKDVASFGYKDSFLIMSNTLAKLDTKLLERIVAQKWSGKNYSDRIWKNKNNLVKRLVKNITVGLAQGFEFKKMSSRLARDLDIGFYEARRIIETETTGALENAKAQAFKDMGISKYKFVATLDDRTSEICRSLNGQVFEMKDRQVGINCPFCHPFCRSITIPVVDKKAESRIDEIKENNLKEKEKESKIEEKNYNKISGISKGKPMTFEEANSGNVNPNFGKDEGYRINCQTCVVTFEARLRGYDVEALPNTKGSFLEKLSYRTNLAWIDKKTGKNPEYIKAECNNAKEYLKFLKETLEPKSRYTIEFIWKGNKKTGHIINLDLTENGEIRLKDNQITGYYKDQYIGDKEVLRYLSEMKYTKKIYGTKFYSNPKLLKIDDLDFDYDFINNIMKGK